MTENRQCLEVWGDLACFSRPELKVERFSYPCITPSAARGIFDAIYVKPPEFRWQVTRIDVLARPEFIALRRNEVKDVVNTAAVRRWMAGSEPEPLWADGDRELLRTDEKGRTQRQTMALRKVRYRLYAAPRPWSGHEKRLPAIEAQFRRRASQGKCFYQPYLGCREFPAYFRLTDSESPDPAPSEWSQDLGLMLYDVFDLSRPGDAYAAPAICVFPARVERGILKVPDYQDAAVRKAVAVTTEEGL